MATPSASPLILENETAAGGLTSGSFSGYTPAARTLGIKSTRIV
jgi:hypothetical protein